ncbi:hypothetical protein ACFL1H_00535 [Nanoarchaeota archaeon]
MSKIDLLIEELNLKDHKLYKKIDIILDYLYDNFWFEGKEKDKSFYNYVKLEPNFILNHPKLDKIIEIASNNRKNDKEIMKQFFKREEDLEFDKLKEELIYCINNRENDKEADMKLMLYFGNKTADYSGDDILELGFMPQSCISFSLFAYELMTKTGEEAKLIVMEADKFVHGILAYKDNLYNHWFKCDPKWQKHDKFTSKPKELIDKFIKDPYFYVNVKAADKDGKCYEYEKVNIVRG